MVLDAHGGLDRWKEQRTLRYTMPDEGGSETQTIDLYSRMDRTESDGFSMGFDGTNVWTLDPEKAYEGNPEFSHNLMFYFYAMPFVLADDGIQYGETEPLVFEGREYPGISISYSTGVGASPKDEYYLHYDTDTGRMAWLGYTVTYFSGEDSDNIRWIHYNDWEEVNGLLLPRSMTWHEYEGREIKGPKGTATFEDIELSEQPLPESFYDMPENAEVFKEGE